MASKSSPQTAGAITPNELNPRDISKENLEMLRKSLEAHGDLSGVVFNRRTKRQVGGHQRMKITEEDAEIVCKYFDKKDAQGTVGMGYIMSKKFGRLVYREVDWPKEMEAAAMIAANYSAGKWNDKLLRETLTLISESNKVDSGTLGLTDEFMEQLFKGEELTLNVQAQEATSLTEPLTITDMQNLPSQTQMIQLFFTVKTRAPLVECLKQLQVIYGTANVSETVEKMAYETLKLKKKSGKK
jgi:hypothetical protein